MQNGNPEESNVPVCDCGKEMRYSLSTGEFYCLKCVYEDLKENVYTVQEDWSELEEKKIRKGKLNV